MSKRERSPVDDVLSQLPSAEAVLAEELQNPEFRAIWQRTALARLVALRVLDYRTREGITQTALARRLGMRQPQIARLEDGEHTPTLATLMRLAQLGLGFRIEISPAVHPHDDITMSAAGSQPEPRPRRPVSPSPQGPLPPLVEEDVASDGTRLRVAAT